MFFIKMAPIQVPKLPRTTFARMRLLKIRRSKYALLAIFVPVIYTNKPETLVSVRA